MTRKESGDFFRFACRSADEAFRRSQETAGLASWTLDSVTIEDIGGTDADHILVDASEDVREVIEKWCARARATALEYVRDSDPYDDAFDAGAHRKIGVMYGRVMGALGIDEVIVPLSVPEGAEMFAMQRIYDAAWTAFGDEVDRLRAK